MTTSNFPLLTRLNISDEVYETLKANILSRYFAPGERLNLALLEQQMGVSRTPLKDAVNRLSVEGLVKIEPRKGTFVTDPSAEEIAECFDVRRVLEVYAVELAAQRITGSQLAQMREIVSALRKMAELDNWEQIYQGYISLDYKLHRLILEISGNRHLQSIWEQVNVYSEMVRINYGRSIEETRLAQQEHEAILRGFETKDLAAVQDVVSHHIERVKRSIIQHFSSSKGGDSH